MARGPRVSGNVVVWAMATGILRGHSQLKPEMQRLMPHGYVGGWMRGVVVSSAARTVARKPIWKVHFAGLAWPYDMERGRFHTAAPDEWSEPFAQDTSNTWQAGTPSYSLVGS